MTKEVLKDPQIYISKTAKEIFTNMKLSYAEFKHLENKDLLFLAFIFGYVNNKRKPIPKNEMEQSGFTREKYLTDQENAILKAVAIEEKNSIEIIDNIAETYSITEEYANGGIDYLKKFIFADPATTVKKLSAFLKKHNK